MAQLLREGRPTDEVFASFLTYFAPLVAEFSRSDEFLVVGIDVAGSASGRKPDCASVSAKAALAISNKTSYRARRLKI